MDSVMVSRRVPMINNNNKKKNLTNLSNNFAKKIRRSRTKSAFWEALGKKFKRRPR